MKFVQLLRPLFFVALGLHALVLFLPYGEAETVVVEDIEVSEASTPLSDGPPGALPVPDPNVTTGTKTPPAAPGAASPAAKASANAVAARPAGTSGSAAAGARGRAAANSRGASSNTATGSSANSSANSSSANSAEGGDRNATRAESSQSSSEDSSDSGLAVFEPPIDDPGADVTVSNNDSDDGSDSSNDAINALLAKVTRQVPESLRAFALYLDKSLTYDAENTDDASVQRAKEAWQADIQQQANVGQVERMAPTEIVELTQIEYPIEESVKPGAKGRSLRRCLTEDPKTAEIGVRFDAGGDISGEPVLLRSTGYFALNEEIQALVAAYDDFPSDRASKAYTFEVEVFYDAELCITAAELQR